MANTAAIHPVPFLRDDELWFAYVVPEDGSLFLTDDLEQAGIDTGFDVGANAAFDILQDHSGQLHLIYNADSANTLSAHESGDGTTWTNW